VLVLDMPGLRSSHPTAPSNDAGPLIERLNGVSTAAAGEACRCIFSSYLLRSTSPIAC